MNKWGILVSLKPYKNFYNDSSYIEGTYDDACREAKWMCENLVTNYDMWYELTDTDDGTWNDIKNYCHIEIFKLSDNFEF